MANVNNPFGAKVIGNFSTSGVDLKVNKYYVPSTDSTALYIGDFVKTNNTATSDGIPIITRAAAGESVRGIITAFEALRSTENVTYRAASTAMYVYVCDDPYAELEMQVNGTLATTHFGKYFNLSVAAGNTITGLSGTTIDLATASTTSAQVKIISIVERLDNSVGAYAKVKCVIHDHELQHGITGSIENIWKRTGTTIEPYNAGDDLDVGAGLINTDELYQIGGSNVLSIPGTGNTCIGEGSDGSLTSGQDNLFVGYNAGAATTTGSYNCYLGYESGKAGITAQFNTAFGYKTLTAVTNASNNTVMGNQCGAAITTGGYNTLIGTSAGVQTTTASNTIGIGRDAARINNANYTIAIGYQAGRANLTNTGNIYIGKDAGLVATGANNTIIGYESGDSITTGANNTLYGYQAGAALTTADGNVHIGYQAGSQSTDSNKLFIDNSNTTTPLIGGDFSTSTLNFRGNVVIGIGAAGVDYTLTFNGEDNDGVITWKEDEDTFDLSCSLSLNSGQAVDSISTDTTLGGTTPLDTTISSQKALKTYIDNIAQGLHWQKAVKNQIDFTTAEPGSPTPGDRYINTVTGTSSVTTQSVTATYIYEWNGTNWTETVPSEGFALWDEAANLVYVFNDSGVWVPLGGTQSFLHLTDTPSSFTAAGAIYNVNGTTDAVAESSVILAEGTNTFSITKGTASLDIAAGAALNVDANLDVEATSAINQDLTTDSATAQLASLTISGLSDGLVKSTSGLLSGGNSVTLTSEVTGILPIANGGTNSSTALNNDRVIISSGGAIVESATITTTELGLLNGIVSVSTGTGDNDKFVTQGYVDDAVATVDSWDEVMHLGNTFTVANTENLSATINQNDTTNNPAALIITNTGSGNDITLPNSSYIKNGTLVLGADVGLTGTRITKGWFTDLEITNMPTVSGTSINDNGVLSLTSAEVTQLANIDTTTITAGQWVYLGALDQGVATTDAVTHDDLTLTGKRIESVATPATYLAAETISGDETNHPVAGNGGAVTLTSNPQIAAGTSGERKRLIGTDDTNTLTVVNGNGLALDNGQSFTLGQNDIIEFVYYNSLWIETSRVDN